VHLVHAAPIALQGTVLQCCTAPAQLQALLSPVNLMLLLLLLLLFGLTCLLSTWK
jgi:hypothetical protein